jgi:hypothetical protein
MPRARRTKPAPNRVWVVFEGDAIVLTVRDPEEVELMEGEAIYRYDLHKAK